VGAQLVLLRAQVSLRQRHRRGVRFDSQRAELRRSRHPLEDSRRDPHETLPTALRVQNILQALAAACHCPQIAKTVLDLLRSCPSEAPVERLFSKLKYSFDQWRCNATVDLVNAVLRTQSGFAYFHPVLELPDVVVPPGSKDKDPTPAKAARAEGQTTATPARDQPTATAVGTPQQQIVPQPPRTAAAAPPAAPAEVNQVIDDDDEEPGFRIPNSVEYVFGYVLDLLSSEVAAPPLPNTGATKSTRSVADKCSKCHAPCKRHEYAAYIVCKLCPRDRHDYYPAKIP
jgi:hypothetical protein